MSIDFTNKQVQEAITLLNREHPEVWDILKSIVRNPLADNKKKIGVVATAQINTFITFPFVAHSENPYETSCALERVITDVVAAEVRAECAAGPDDCQQSARFRANLEPVMMSECFTDEQIEEAVAELNRTRPEVWDLMKSIMRDPFADNADKLDRVALASINAFMLLPFVANSTDPYETQLALERAVIDRALSEVQSEPARGERETLAEWLGR